MRIWTKDVALRARRAKVNWGSIAFLIREDGEELSSQASFGVMRALPSGRNEYQDPQTSSQAHYLETR